MAKKIYLLFKERNSKDQCAKQNFKKNQGHNASNNGQI